MTKPFAIAVLVLVSVGPAQGRIVSPPGLEAVVAGLPSNIPFGPPFTTLAGETFYQQIDEGLRGAPRLLTGLAFRPAPRDTAAPDRGFDLTLTIGDAAAGAGGISATFAQNWRPGGSRAVVFRGRVDFPAVQAPAWPVPFGGPLLPFAAAIPFAAPLPYAGVDPVLWQIDITSTTTGPTRFGHEIGCSDCPYGQPQLSYTSSAIGTGCLVFGATVPVTATGITSDTSMFTECRFAPVRAPAALFFGDTSPTVGGVPLPLDLGYLGIPNCALYINPIAAIPRTISVSGVGSYTLALPAALTGGQRYRLQWVCVEGTRLRTSNGIENGVPYSATRGHWPQARAFALGYTTVPASGQVNLHTGLVTEWRTQ